MIEHRREAHLPQVTLEDILRTFTDAALDPDRVNSAWKFLSETQPELAREILSQSIFDFPNQPINHHEARRLFVENAAFIVQALGHAATRESFTQQIIEP